MLLRNYCCVFELLCELCQYILAVIGAPSVQADAIAVPFSSLQKQCQLQLLAPALA
jgi:hypothetical protein